LSVQKSPDAFRTISEVASELDVPQHVLRFWESKFNQIRPLKRGGGRRYYRPEDVDLLRGVRTLLYNDGYTIKGVQKVFREQGLKFVAETGRGTVDTSLAELAREAVERSEQEEREPSGKPRDRERPQAPGGAAGRPHLAQGRDRRDLVGERGGGELRKL